MDEVSAAAAILAMTVDDYAKEELRHPCECDCGWSQSAANGEPSGRLCLPDGSFFASPTPRLPSGRLWGAANGEPPPPALLIHTLAPARLVLTVPSLMLADTCMCTAAVCDGAGSLPLMPAATVGAAVAAGGLEAGGLEWIRWLAQRVEMCARTRIWCLSRGWCCDIGHEARVACARVLAP